MTVLFASFLTRRKNVLRNQNVLCAGFTIHMVRKPALNCGLFERVRYSGSHAATPVRGVVRSMLIGLD